MLATPSANQDARKMQQWVSVDKKTELEIEVDDLAPVKDMPQDKPEPPIVLAERKELKGTNLVLAKGTPLLSKGKGKGSNMGDKIVLPPTLDATVTFRKVFRYVAQGSSASGASCTVGQMLESFGSVATATTQITSITSAFKLHSLTFYPAASGVCGVEWVDAATTGLNQKDSYKNAPVPTGITVSHPVRFTPPKDSQVSWWWDGQASGVTLLALYATVGCYLDVDVSVCISNRQVNVQETGFTGLTVGAVYYPSLDGRSTNKFAPFGRTNAT